VFRGRLAKACRKKGVENKKKAVVAGTRKPRKAWLGRNKWLEEDCRGTVASQRAGLRLPAGKGKARGKRGGGVPTAIGWTERPTSVQKRIKKTGPVLPKKEGKDKAFIQR